MEGGGERGRDAREEGGVSNVLEGAALVNVCAHETSQGLCGC